MDKSKDILLSIDIVNQGFLAKHRLYVKIGETSLKDKTTTDMIKEHVRTLIVSSTFIKGPSPLMLFNIDSKQYDFCRNNLGISFSIPNKAGFTVDVRENCGLEPWKINGLEGWGIIIDDICVSAQVKHEFPTLH